VRLFSALNAQIDGIKQGQFVVIQSRGDFLFGEVVLVAIQHKKIIFLIEG
jgi:hypothetical protein